MLVCVGSCLIMIVSAFGFADVLGTPHVELDPSRIAAQVVSGVGFLGAGAILLRGEMVRGLTTAASIWAVAGIGLAVGSGLYWPAVASTVIILLILAGLKPLEDRYRLRHQTARLKIQAQHRSFTIDNLRPLMGLRAEAVRQFVSETGRDDIDQITITFERLSHDDALALAKEIGRLPGVTGATVEWSATDDE
jgi:putative Mg2+ transporter-C (MgtC) family protein